MKRFDLVQDGICNSECCTARMEETGTGKYVLYSVLEESDATLCRLIDERDAALVEVAKLKAQLDDIYKRL